MKQFKGTKGPWVYDDYRRAIGVVSKDDDQSFGMVCGEVAWVEFIGKGVETHNANLIAAAPELLEALQGILECHESILFNEFGEESDLCTTRAKSAIKKALGE